MNEEMHLDLPAAKKQRLNNGEASCSTSIDNSEPSCSHTPDLPNGEPSCSLTTATDNDVDVDNEDDKCSEESYGNYVNPEEVERLKEFKVLDEVKSNDEDSNEEESESSEGRCCCL